MALARPIANATDRGNARYHVGPGSGLQRGERGWTDGTYWYDDNGLSLDRPDVYVQGIGSASDSDSYDPWTGKSRASGGGGGGGGGIPGAGLYAQAVNAAKARYQQRLADLNKSRQSTFRQSGFKGDINEESGLVSNLRVDPYNQYGSFQLLNKAQAQRADQGQSQNIERGLGTRGGLAAQNMNELRFGFGQEDASFGAGLTDQLGAFTRQQQDYKYEYDAAMYQAQLEAARMAIENGDFYGYGEEGGYEEGGGTETSLAGQFKGLLGAQPPVASKKVKKRKPKPAAGFGGGLGAAQIAARRRGRR